MKWTHLFCVMFQCMFWGRGREFDISLCSCLRVCVCVCIRCSSGDWRGPLNRAHDKVRWLLDEGEPNNVVECSALSKTFHAAVKDPKTAHTHSPPFRPKSIPRTLVEHILGTVLVGPREKHKNQQKP